MTSQCLSSQAEEQLNNLVERLVRASGQDSYQEHIKRKVAQARLKLRRKMDKAKTKLGRGLVAKDLAEEIHQYLADGVRELIAEGLGEAEAVREMADRFDQAEATPGYAGFALSFNDFGLVEAYAQAAGYPGAPPSVMAEATGLFYAGFFMLGLALGPALGWLIGRTWLALGIGAGIGVGSGLALGLLSNAVISLRRTR